MALSPKVGDKLAFKLSKLYARSTRIDEEYKGNDITFMTDDEGNPVLLFVGERQPDGSIKGDRFARRIVKDAAGKVIKSHWDYKGKTTR